MRFFFLALRALTFNELIAVVDILPSTGPLKSKNIGGENRRLTKLFNKKITYAFVRFALLNDS